MRCPFPYFQPVPFADASLNILPPAALIRVASPHPALGLYVRAYLQVEQQTAETTHIGALPSPVLAVTWGGAVQIRTGLADTYPVPFVSLVGALSRGHTVEIGAGASGFHVRFGPTGARALLGERPVADTWDDGLPAAIVRWAEAIVEAPSFEARVALADAFWRSRLPHVEVWSGTPADLVTSTAGTMAVTALADALGVSARTLRRRFFDDTGLGVKTFAQIERYRQAHGYLLRTPEATWRDVCERYGYADQAHFVRSFRRFTGEAPTRWRPDSHSLDLGMGLRDEGASGRGR